MAELPSESSNYHHDSYIGGELLATFSQRTIVGKIIDVPSRTFGEYLLLPNLTQRNCIPENVDLNAPMVRYSLPPGSKPQPERSPLSVKVPITSALMQAVSSEDLAIALASSGGLSFIHGSQSIDEQTEMVRRVKSHKAGFVISDSNVAPTATLSDVLAVTAATGHSTVAVTSDGTALGELLGLITDRDYRLSRTPRDTLAVDLMTPFEKLICSGPDITLSAANDKLWEHKLSCLPIVDEDRNLQSIVFRKDYERRRSYPLENVDAGKRLIVGAGINTHDYIERVPALLHAEADILCIDSSDGFSEWQSDAIRWIKSRYDGHVFVGAGNVVDREGFLYLVEAGADFVKVGIGGGSICITREQKGIGRGQATALIEVVEARDRYFEETGIYVPVCSDGGISQDYHITLALAMGADFVMMGRYFARFEEAPGRKVLLNGQFVKEYWGEGSNRARNWQRYGHGDNAPGSKAMVFEEGVDSYVPYAGRLDENLGVTLAKVKATMCSCGATSLVDFAADARLTLVSSTSIREGGAHDVVPRNVEAAD